MDDEPVSNLNTNKEDPMLISCEWTDCPFSSTSEDTFYNHVSYHLPDLKVIKHTDGEEMYECQWAKCLFTTKDPDLVTRHVKYHGYHRILKTRGQTYAKKKGLPSCTYTEEDTLPLEHNEPIVCLWEHCDETCPGIKEIIDHIAFFHIRSLSEKPHQKYSCAWNGCTASTNKKSRLLEHVKVHTGEKKTACPQCGNVFASNAKFEDHCHRQLPVDEKSHQCNYCFSYLPSERLLRDHMRQHVHHYKCNFCGMTCHTPGILKRHIKYRHTPSRKYACPLCSSKCKTHTDLRQHLLRHTENKFTELSCNEPNCNFKCKLQSVLTRHFYKEHSENLKGGRYCCHLCDKSYTRGFSLTRHLCSMHNVRKPSEYSRFIYKAGGDGYNRLQTIRLESLEVAENDKKVSNECSDEDVDEPEAVEGQESSGETEKDINERITIDVVDESGKIILSNNVDAVIAEDSLPPDAKIVAIGH
ncbi:histone H4 transcription factor [Cimex lectularius]|uniref:C2H2-type domain-containing protein n=1 Tax=Cimex lectularius TaxID=79782 RepID=A0A8I6RFX9_CIMLE|nr:histone H4 transcription factor [Cimex lectularius]